MLTSILNFQISAKSKETLISITKSERLLEGAERILWVEEQRLAEAVNTPVLFVAVAAKGNSSHNSDGRGRGGNSNDYTEFRRQCH